MKDRNRHARPAPAPATKSIQIQISDRAEEQLTMLANHRQIAREALVSEIVLSEAARLREIEKAAAAGHPHESELEEVTTYQGDGDTQHAIFKRKGRAEYWIQKWPNEWNRTTEKAAVKDWARWCAPNEWEKPLIALIARHWP
jgi:thiol-disulfide isomerase/thioredoxin